jgi:hypothetical protein
LVTALPPSAGELAARLRGAFDEESAQSVFGAGCGMVPLARLRAAVHSALALPPPALLAPPPPPAAAPPALGAPPSHHHADDAAWERRVWAALCCIVDPPSDPHAVALWADVEAHVAPLLGERAAQLLHQHQHQQQQAGGAAGRPRSDSELARALSLEDWPMEEGSGGEATTHPAAPALLALATSAAAAGPAATPNAATRSFELFHLNGLVDARRPAPRVVRCVLVQTDSGLPADAFATARGGAGWLAPAEDGGGGAAVARARERAEATFTSVLRTKWPGVSAAFDGDELPSLYLRVRARAVATPAGRIYICRPGARAHA